MKNLRLLWVAGLVGVIALGVWRLRRNQPQPSPIAHAKPVPSAPAPSLAAPPVHQDGAFPGPPVLTAEVAATEKMYAAHAPLRVPEVANPDSVSNRQILSTMVAKALARTPSPSPVNSQP